MRILVTYALCFLGGGILGFADFIAPIGPMTPWQFAAVMLAVFVIAAGVAAGALAATQFVW